MRTQLLFSMLLVACGPQDAAAPNAPAHEDPPGDRAGYAAQGSAIPPPQPVGCVSDVSAGKRTLACGTITADLHVPAACITTACGLIVDVHGLTMNGAMQEKNTELAALAGPEGYLVLQPNAPGSPPFSMWQPAHDVLVYQIMLQVMAAFSVDSKRVHFTGFSQGGQMSWRFIKSYASLLASAAPAGFCLGKAHEPSVAIPVLHMQGNHDTMVNMLCGKPAQSTVAALTKLWGLGAPTTIAQGAGYQQLRYTGPTGEVLEVLTHDYAAKASLLAGHCYPGSKDVDGGSPGQLFGFGCTGAPPIHWGKLVLAFFKAHPRP